MGRQRVVVSSFDPTFCCSYTGVIDSGPMRRPLLMMAASSVCFALMAFAAELAAARDPCRCAERQFRALDHLRRAYVKLINLQNFEGGVDSSWRLGCCLL